MKNLKWSKVFTEDHNYIYTATVTGSYFVNNVSDGKSFERDIWEWYNESDEFFITRLSGRGLPDFLTVDTSGVANFIECKHARIRQPIEDIDSPRIVDECNKILVGLLKTQNHQTRKILTLVGFGVSVYYFILLKSKDHIPICVELLITAERA